MKSKKKKITVGSRYNESPMGKGKKFVLSRVRKKVRKEFWLE